jgi:6-phosphogluconolactonase
VACQNDKKAIAFPHAYNMYVGTYTKHEAHVEGKGKGIYHIQLDDALNVVSESVITDAVNPAFIVLSHDEKYLYCAEETAPEGTVKAFDLTYEQPKLISKANSQGAAPCYIDINQNDSYVVIANYGGGSTSSFPIAKDGKFTTPISTINFTGRGPTARQEAPHAHSANFLPGQLDHFFVNDLGTDKTHVLEIGGNGQLRVMDALVANDSAGPRHTAFLSASNFYILNELNSTVSVFVNNLKMQVVSTLPSDYTNQNLCADIHITPDGRFLYASNRFHNSLAIFSINAETHLLTFLGTEPSRGEIPRNFNITPDGKYLFCANQNSDNIIIFEINADGKLMFKKELKVATPVCIKFAK